MNTNPLETVNDKWFLNLSGYEIPFEVASLLQLGDGFSLPISINRKKAVHEFIKELESNGSKYTVDNQVRIRNVAITQFHKFLKSNIAITPIERNLIDRYHCTLRFQKSNSDIIFTRADKGSVTVALDKNVYIRKMELLLKDKDTYEIVRRNPSARIEKDLNALIVKWLDREYITKREYFALRSSDSNLPKAYGLPKIHKENVPFRVIVSSVNTALYGLASLLQKILADSLPKPKSHVNNSFELCTELSGVLVQDHEILISLDVISLFTNVPSQLVVEGIEKRWEIIKTKTRLPRREFVSAVKFILESTFFTFNNVIYKQSFGSPMGSPLSPTAADIVMEDLEVSVLSTLEFRISFYRRYVDDIVMKVHKDKVFEVLERFNSYHERIKFTLELEEEGRLSFLDVLLIRENDGILTDWFHKKTFSGRLLSFVSNHPLQHKIGTIYSLVDRAILLSHPSFFQKNLTLIVQVLLGNGYPIELIFFHINRRLRNLRIEYINNRDNDNEVIHEDKKFIVVPFLSSMSKRIMSAVDKTENSVGYRILNKLSNIIKVHKDRDALLASTNVIYRIDCKECDASYVGQTKRQLQTRLKEHKRNIKCDRSKHTVVSEHSVKYGHTFDWDNTRILEIEHNYKKRLTAEMIYIKEQKNGVNLNKDTELLNEAYFDLLNTLSR